MLSCAVLILQAATTVKQGVNAASALCRCQAYLGKAQRLVSRYSDRLFWQVSSCSLSMRKVSSRPSTLQASNTLGFLAVSCMIFFQALSMPSKRFASCRTVSHMCQQKCIECWSVSSHTCVQCTNFESLTKAKIPAGVACKSCQR